VFYRKTPAALEHGFTGLLSHWSESFACSTEKAEFPAGCMGASRSSADEGSWPGVLIAVSGPHPIKKVVVF